MDDHVLSALRRIERRLARIEAALAKLKVPPRASPAKGTTRRKPPARRIKVPAHI